MEDDLSRARNLRVSNEHDRLPYTIVAGTLKLSWISTVIRIPLLRTAQHSYFERLNMFQFFQNNCTT